MKVEPYMKLELLMTSAAVFSFISYLPQFIVIIKNKDSKNISVLAWVMYVWSTLCYLIYSLQTGTIAFMIGSSIEFLFCIVILGAVLYFKVKNKISNKKSNVTIIGEESKA